MTAGEIMQLPAGDEIVMVAGVPPIRAKKARYFEDRQLQARILPPPKPARAMEAASGADPSHSPNIHDWTDAIVVPQPSAADDPANAGIRREPELPEHEEIAPEPRKPAQEFEPLDDEPNDDAQRARVLQRQVRAIARQVALDPGDGMEL